ncbi:hypothetical protein AAHA92_17575 [Salvia divinorum]|uniref:Myb/SANT-like domain-containing protein n=1 Tax=Salvia divinorum TaxID=28513 RepID=A0ABD1H2E2_SALDI
MADSKRVAGVSKSGFTSQGSSESGRQKFRKGDRSRRMWSDREEEILASALMELVVRGWKSDNGFRAGYLTQLEQSLRMEFPSTDIKGTPHITSKISAWKKSYNSLQAILSRSGIGFNVHGNHKIDCEDEQWEQIVHMDSNAKFMRYKSWPFWEQWKTIFGKDRATGGVAEDIDFAAKVLRSQNAGDTQGIDNDYHVSFEDFIAEDSTPVRVVPENHDDSTAHSEQHVANKRISGAKRKINSSDVDLMIGYEFDLGKARQEIFTMLGNVEGLSIEQRYELCDILGDKSQRLEIFMGMPAEARLGYVLRLIEQNHKPT